MQKIARLTDIPLDRGLKVRHDGEDVVLVRDGDAVRAYGAACPHAGGPLDEGAVCSGRIICPWHKAEFSVADGALIEPPALAALIGYAVTIEGDDVLIGSKLDQDRRGRKTAAAAVSVIVGDGAAGAAAASALREFHYDGRIVLVGREAEVAYDRTALSKFVMAGQMKPADVPSLQPEEFYAAHQIERVTGEIERLDVLEKQATLADGTRLPFDTALICTGAVPSRLDIPGGDLPGVHSLRSLADAALIVRDLRAGARAVILGSSFIGLEAACGLREQTLEVSVASPEAVPFARQFGGEIGSAIRALHEANGVQFHSGTRAVRIEGEGRVTTVVLDNGTRLAADIVLVAIGVKPATAFVQGVERGQDGGLVADATMQIGPDVFVAGDVASFPLPRNGGRARIEHWRVAQQQARIAARNIAGQRATYDGVPFFWTYHYGKRFEYLGHADAWDEVVIDGDLHRQKFLAFLCQRGLVRAVVACERERETAVLIDAMRRELPQGEATRLAGRVTATAN
jgi:NADPH-dependent 2,4-dienoyl-CoA reductase/sulfur reductase-like enzyme/nitrite reductase/ring-hydroxylating ferredoxin subunit